MSMCGSWDSKPFWHSKIHSSHKKTLLFACTAEMDRFWHARLCSLYNTLQRSNQLLARATLTKQLTLTLIKSSGIKQPVQSIPLTPQGCSMWSRFQGERLCDLAPFYIMPGVNVNFRGNLSLNLRKITCMRVSSLCNITSYVAKWDIQSLGMKGTCSYQKWKI